MNKVSTGAPVEQISLPWYRYFMPWFVLLLLLTAMASTLLTVVIAVRNPPTIIKTLAPSEADQPAPIRSSGHSE